MEEGRDGGEKYEGVREKEGRVLWIIGTWVEDGSGRGSLGN